MNHIFVDLYFDSLVFEFCPLLISILILFVFVFEFNYIFVPRFGFAICETVEAGGCYFCVALRETDFCLDFFVIFIFIESYLCGSIY